MISIYEGRRDDMRDGRQLAVEIIFSVTDNTLIAELFGELDHHAAEGAREKIDEALDNYRVDKFYGQLRYRHDSGTLQKDGRTRRQNSYLRMLKTGEKHLEHGGSIFNNRLF